jgi:hypothetical protein
MMAVVAIGAISMGMLRFASELAQSTRNEWNTSILQVGQRVITFQDITEGGSTLPAGTRGFVTCDPPDEDSAYPYRMVGVKLTEGQHRGTTRTIQRQFLRID